MTEKKGHGSAAAHGHEESTPDRCNLCSASCSATPLVRVIEGVPEPCAIGAATFPRLTVPAPSFLSDGQERPPRSI